MRRIFSILLGGLLISTVCSVVFAEKPKGSMMPQEIVLNKYLVTIKDGGVIVMAGNRLWKYDKNLDFIKEVEIKMDIGGVIRQMREDCPMYKKYKAMMKDTGMVGETMEELESSAESQGIPRLVATKDGGVIVMAGNRLWKYDKNLDLKNELNIKMYIEKMMMQIREECPYKKKMMEGPAMISEIKQGQEESGKVHIQVVGFLSHVPVERMIADIDGILNKYANNVAVEMIEVTSEDGEVLLEKKSLKEFKSKVDGYAIFIDGKYQFDINGKEVTLKGCPLERNWEIKDLDGIIQQKILEKQE